MTRSLMDNQKSRSNCTEELCCMGGIVRSSYSKAAIIDWMPLVWRLPGPSIDVFIVIVGREDLRLIRRRQNSKQAGRDNLESKLELSQHSVYNQSQSKDGCVSFIKG